MTYKKLILKYLSDNLSRQEKNIFEQKMKSDFAFKREYEKINSTLLEIKKSKNISADENYFINLPAVPQVKPKNKYNKIFQPAFTLAITIASTLIVFLFLEQNSNSIKNNSKISMGDLNEKEVDYLVDITPEELFDETIIYKELDEDLSNLLTSELDINNESITLVYDDVESIVSDITGSEADQIYNELINKDFLK